MIHRALTPTTDVPAVLLLTGNAPGTQGIGQLFLRDLVRLYPAGRMSCFAVVEPGMESNDAEIARVPMAHARRPRESGIARLGSAIQKMTALAVWEANRLGRMPRMARAVRAFAAEQKPQLLWAVLSSPALIVLADHVSRGLRIPLVTTIWDPPEMLTANLGYPGVARREVKRIFGRVLRRSVRAGVASEGMADEYRREFGITPVVQIRGTDGAARRPAREPASSSELTIAFAGSIYTPVEWRALLAALSSAGWKVGGRQVRLKVLATRFPFEMPEGAPVEFLGWRTPDETLDVLSWADVLYLPYWFDDEHRDIVRLCFPNKLATYVAAGRPVLYHGPRESSVTRFLATYPVGVGAFSTATTEILAAIEQVAGDSGMFARVADAGSAALRQELGHAVFRRRFAELIGVDEQVLRDG